MSTINVLDATGATVAVNTPNADGQATMANSRSVVIASDQSAVATTISGTLPAFAATPTFNLGGTLPAFAATPTFNFGTLNGAATEATLAAASAKLPAALGQTVRASALSVTIASDQGPIDVNQPDVVVAATNITTQNLVPAGAATANSAVTLTVGGRSGLIIQVTSTYTGALSLQGTIDGANWVTLGGTPLINAATGVAAATIASATQSIFSAKCSGYNQVRVTALAAVTGVATVTMRASDVGTIVGINDPLPTGAATIGAVNIAAAQTLATVTTVGTVTTLANGQTAHSAASTGSPVRVGGRVNTTVDTTLVAGDASDLFMTTGGAAVVKPFAVPEVDWQATSGITALATTTSTPVRAAAAAGIRNYVTAIQLVNNSASVSTTVTILDGAAVLWTGFLPATTATLPVVPVMVNFPTPLRGTAVTAINIQLGTTAASVFWNAQGYAAP